MDLSVLLKTFADELEIVEYDETKTFAEVESFYKDIVLIVKKDETFLDESRVLFQRPLNSLNPEVVWKHLPISLFVSFTTGDIRDKLSSVLSIAKTFLSENPNAETDNISRILHDETAQSSIEQFIDYCTNTRIANVLNSILSDLDVSEFEHLLKTPAEFLTIARNPEHPIVKKFIQKFQSLLKQKVETGEISQNRIQEDIEGIKAKLISIFGGSLSEALGGRQSEVSSAVLTSNTPEARRQRMIARLQRKQREKTQR
jgi:hypothetical protein